MVMKFDNETEHGKCPILFYLQLERRGNLLANLRRVVIGTSG